MSVVAVEGDISSRKGHSWDANWSLRHLLVGLAPIMATSVALRCVPDVIGRTGVLALWAAQYCWLGVFPAIMRRRLAIPRWGGQIDFAGIRYGLLVGLGLIVVSAVYSILAGGAQFELDSHAVGRVVGGTDVPAAIAFAIFGSTVGPWIEERFFRGFLLHALTRRTSLPLGVVLQAVFFAAVHSYGLVASVSVLIGGVILGTVARLRGSLVLAITAHVAVNSAAFTVTALESHRERAWIGIRAEPVNEENRQFQVVTHVEVDSPASRAGLQVGDMLYTADGRGMPASFRDFAHWVQGRSVGDTVVLQFRRQSQYYRTEAVLEEFPRFDENGRREPSQSTNPDGR